ncbi:MAG TPA: hypothetical protein VFW09_04570 [Solirubrobacteraceae bacterium]|nr:hypothetical protein [Solirubrobacteraceae bacterium]
MRRDRTDATQRDPGGYLITSPSRYATSTYALESASYHGGTAAHLFSGRDLLGTIRVRVHSTRPLFVGIGRERAVDRYLTGVAHARGDRFDAPSSDFRVVSGNAPGTPPAAQRFWNARAAGAGERTLTWTPRAGKWRVVVMNADGSSRVAAEVSVGARMPHLLAIALGVLGVGLVLLLAAAAGLVATLRRR